jgi:hypothetical protein
MSLPDINRFRKRQNAVHIAQGFLSGRIRLLHAAEQLAFLSGDVDVDQFDSDFFTFVMIHSDADDLIRHSAPESLDDPEILSFEAERRDDAIEAASNLVKRFADEQAPQSDWM